MTTMYDILLVDDQVSITSDEPEISHYPLTPPCRTTTFTTTTPSSRIRKRSWMPCATIVLKNADRRCSTDQSSCRRLNATRLTVRFTRCLSRTNQTSRSKSRLTVRTHATNCRHKSFSAHHSRTHSFALGNQV